MHQGCHSGTVLYDAEYILYLYKYANQTRCANLARAFYSKIFCALAAFDVMHVISILTSKSCSLCAAAGF